MKSKTPKRFFRIAYSNPTYDNKLPRLHQVRDGAAFCELSASLIKSGLEYGTVIHFYPNHKIHANAFRFLDSSNTLLVQTTRPPFKDSHGNIKNKSTDKDKRVIARSEHTLEEAIFTAIKPFFSWVSRYFVELSPTLADRLPDKRRDMANLEFSSYLKGRIKSKAFSNDPHTHRRRVPKSEQHAVGYLVHVPKMEGFQCGLILSFSMGGYENLLWNRLVRLNKRGWLEKPVFVFAELKLPEEPEQPLTPMFVDGVATEVLIEYWLEP
jgi:hypothetical protein